MRSIYAAFVGSALLSTTVVAAPSRTLIVYLSERGQVYVSKHVPISRKTLIAYLTNGMYAGPYDCVIIKASPRARYDKVVALEATVKRYGPPGLTMQLSVAGPADSVP